MSEIYRNWHIEKRNYRIEICMDGSSIVLADTPENMKLAEFISAAPKMCEVLQKLIDWNTKYPANREYNNYAQICEIGDLCNEICEEAEQVLKKARGEA